MMAAMALLSSYDGCNGVICVPWEQLFAGGLQIIGSYHLQMQIGYYNEYQLRPTPINKILR